MAQHSQHADWENYDLPTQNLYTYGILSAAFLHPYIHSLLLKIQFSTCIYHISILLNSDKSYPDHPDRDKAYHCLTHLVKTQVILY